MSEIFFRFEFVYLSGIYGSHPCEEKNNSERPLDAVASCKKDQLLTHNLKSRDASASNNVKE